MVKVNYAVEVKQQRQHFLLDVQHQWIVLTEVLLISMKTKKTQKPWGTSHRVMVVQRLVLLLHSKKVDGRQAWDLSVEKLHLLRVSARFSPCSPCVLPHSKDMHIRWTWNSNECMCVCMQSDLSPAVTPVTQEHCGVQPATASMPQIQPGYRSGTGQTASLAVNIWLYFLSFPPNIRLGTVCCAVFFGALYNIFFQSLSFLSNRKLKAARIRKWSCRVPVCKRLFRYLTL